MALGLCDSFKGIYSKDAGDVAKWLRRGFAKPLFGGSIPPVASNFLLCGVWCIVEVFGMRICRIGMMLVRDFHPLVPCQALGHALVFSPIKETFAKLR